jgi:hypothetical protein
VDRRPDQRQHRQPRPQRRRRLRSFTFGNGAPDPFGTSSTYNNTRGLRMKIWINP